MSAENNSPVNDKKMSKAAFGVYASLATLVFIIAMTYCFKTDHMFEFGFVAAIFVLVAGVVSYAYSKL